MEAYMLVEVDIYDNEVYDEYKTLTPGSLIPFGGEFIIRGLPVQALEGEWKHDRLVMIKFPSREKALEWYNSELYLKAREIRKNAASANFFIVG